MGKTYRRDRDIWDEDPVRFENRSRKSKKKFVKQKIARDPQQNNRDYENDETGEDSFYHR